MGSGVPVQELGAELDSYLPMSGPLVMPATIRTKDLETEVVAASGPDWTILRPPRTGSGHPTGRVAVGLTDLAGSRLDVQDRALSRRRPR